MSEIEMFRVNYGDNVTGNGVEFYFRAQTESDRRQICNFCVSEEGIFYYRKGSRIFTPGEDDDTRSTPDGFIAMEDLCNMFEELRRANLHRYEEGIETKLKGSAKGRKVIIELADS